MLADVLGQTVVRPFHERDGHVLALGILFGLGLVATHPVDAFLHFADARQILVELGLVVAADLPAQAGSVVLHPVEDALRAAGAAVLEETVERQRGIDFHRHRRIRALPRDVRAVGHGKVGLVVAGDGLFTTEDHARLDRVLADVVGQHLVHAYAALEHGAFHERHSGKEIAGLPGMDADADRRPVEEAVDEVHLRLQAFHRLEALAEFHAFAGTLRPPVVSVDAIAPEEGGKSFWHRGRGAGLQRLFAERGNGFEPRQGHRHTDAAEKRPAGEPEAAEGGGILFKIAHGFTWLRGLRDHVCSGTADW